MRPRGRALASILLATLAANCGSSATNRIHDLAGREHAPLRVAAGGLHVLVFTSQECPIANAYAPTLRDLAATWETAPVRLFLVHVDPDLTATTARDHASAYELPGTILLDPGHHLATALGIRRTPEAVVLGPDQVFYRGRIDDQWHALGARSHTPAHQDLRDAVAAALRGDALPGPHPEAVGCLLPEPRR